MNNGFYAHFHPDEKAFVDRVQEWLERTTSQHEIRRTDFLDPRQQFIVQTLINKVGDISYRFDGGYDESERKRAIVAPSYIDAQYEDLELSVIEVTSSSDKFDDLDHGDFLGALIGLGIKRDKLGDIFLHSSFCHIVTTKEMANYLDIHLRQVHRLNVFTQIVPIEKLVPIHSEMEHIQFTVSSLRLDAVASDAYRISRAKIVEPIKAGKCRVNWKQEEDPSKQVKMGDVVSLKGLGRFKVLSVGDTTTKKGKIRVEIGKYI